ncbi:hypothetical protein [sulfur-oxidizing endosymbiont of Gigantopelta aegis]|uniref:hypothetical protein n=1 Tax=sulfur-oxidizing endosymbiont of Gigantopelta aegis TaxID=2794934 RepID=UPI001BE48FCB|nr:hypothetical protein [sulfur-oxidizing endosymbiont of Gigantopelta aegis]
MNQISPRSSTAPSTHSSDRVLFYCFLALFIWLPLPLGSNRTWAISVMEVWVYSLALFWLVLFFQQKVRFTGVFRASVVPLLLFCLFLFWTLLQSIALPAQLVAVLSPETLNVYQSTFQILGFDLKTLPLSF